ncbi:MAG: PD-(D/E)XK nuclease family transposase [Prevotella sp.]|nr:PD-(D/E)XK nuclease family transposase [Prevotella sp.]
MDNGKYLDPKADLTFKKVFGEQADLVETLLPDNLRSQKAFIELPKFKPQTIKERKMAVLWLRFLTEINKGTHEAPKELLENPETGKALKILEKSAYTEGELYAYERYWDYVNYERGIVEGGYYKGKAEAEAKAQAKIEEAEAQVKEAEARMEQQKLDTARRMKGKGFDVEDIAEITGLTAEEVASL